MWFRRDLRLSDNPAFAAATSAHRAVVALYVLDDRLLTAAGPFRRRQLVADLHALDGALRETGGRLLVRSGNPVEVVPVEATRLAAARVYWNADVTPYANARDTAVAATLATLAVDAFTPYGHLVHRPGAVLTKGGHVSRVFGPFHRSWLLTPWDPWPAAGDATIVDASEMGQALPPIGSEPPLPAGEEGAHLILRRFLERSIDTYRADRHAISIIGTSQLSAALRFGTISPRRVVEAVGDSSADRYAFVRQLAWRDWFAHLLFENPGLEHRAMQTGYQQITWNHDPAGLDAWKEGRTGYPIVDAGMRELATTGGMHNRVRMITASFLVKDLLIDWRLGERHFRRLLTDGDISQNVGNWQWVAGTGPDAAPYFRVFNPLTQSRVHDPHGVYLRRWLPELAGLDDAAIHAPWQAGPLDLAAAGIRLGEDYPMPLVDHAEARVRAIDAYRAALSAPPSPPGLPAPPAPQTAPGR